MVNKFTTEELLSDGWIKVGSKSYCTYWKKDGEIITVDERIDGSLNVKPLVWSDVFQPNSSIRYTHVCCKHPFGVFVIEWKSWKPCDSFVLWLNDEYLISESTLDEAKSFAKKYVIEVIESCLDGDIK